MCPHLAFPVLILVLPVLLLILPILLLSSSSSSRFLSSSCPSLLPSSPPLRFHVLSALLILLDSRRRHCRVPLPRRYVIMGGPLFTVFIERGSSPSSLLSFAPVILVIRLAIVIPPSNNKCRPHPSGEGRGGTLTAFAGALVVEPTSLRGGEGLAARLLCMVRRELGGRGWWW